MLIGRFSLFGCFRRSEFRGGGVGALKNMSKMYKSGEHETGASQRIAQSMRVKKRK
jgi:hypothetical protein